MCCADYYVHVVVSAGRITWLLRTRILLVVIVSSCFADITYPLCIRIAHLLHYLQTYLLMSSLNFKKNIELKYYLPIRSSNAIVSGTSFLNLMNMVIQGK